jgi:hypothetical protein
VLLIAVSRIPVSAADEWLGTPYDATCWLVLDPRPELTAQAESLKQQVARTLSVRFGQAVSAAVERPPEHLAASLLAGIEPEAELSELGDAGDKLFIISVQATSSGWNCSVRELDRHTRLWSPPWTGEVASMLELERAIWAAVGQVFRPVGRIYRVRQGVAEVHMRAAHLAVQPHSALLPDVGQILLPVIGKTDRQGGAAKDSRVEQVPWTLLEVEAASDKALRCRVISGLRSPLRARTTRLAERYAIVTRPHLAATTVRLVSPNGQPLAGYELYERRTGDTGSRLLGATNWRGELAIVADQRPYRLLYVKSGELLVARLPLVVGCQAVVTAQVRDDTLRLRAEGFLLGLRDELLDETARREVIAWQLERQLDDPTLTDEQVRRVRKTLDGLKSMEVRDAFLRQLELRQTDFQSDDRGVQGLIDRMFRDMRTTIQRVLRTEWLAPLEEKLERRETH